MCLTVPQRVVKISNNTAKMQDGRWVKLSLVKGVKEGDMLLVQANMAVEKVSQESVQAMKETLLPSEDNK